MCTTKSNIAPERGEYRAEKSPTPRHFRAGNSLARNSPLRIMPVCSPIVRAQLRENFARRAGVPTRWRRLFNARYRSRPGLTGFFVSSRAAPAFALGVGVKVQVWHLHRRSHRECVSQPRECLPREREGDNTRKLPRDIVSPQRARSSRRRKDRKTYRDDPRR